MGNCFITRRGGGSPQGFFPSLFVTGLEQTDTCTATCNGKSFVGEWTTKTVESEEKALIPTMTSDTTPTPFVVTSKNVNSSSYSAYMAFDRVGTTCWLSTKNDGTSWVQIDLGKNYNISGYEFVIRSGSSNSKTITAKIQYSTDGSTFTDIASYSKTFSGGASDLITDTTNVVARYIRFQGVSISSDCYFGCRAFQLYGKEDVTVNGFSFPRLTELGTYTVSNGASTMDILVDAPIEYTLEWSAIPRNNLVAEYLFDGDTTDTSPNGNDLTNSGVTFSNNVGVFSGSAKATISQNLIADSTPYSISAWFKTTSTSGGIIGFGDYGTDKKGHMIRVDSGKIQTTASKGTSGTHAFNYSTPSTYNDGLWHHLVLTNDNGSTNNLKLYVDDVLVINQNTNYTIANMTNQLTTIGCLWSSSYATYLNGSLDNIRIYSRVLTDTEIATLFNEGG